MWGTAQTQGPYEANLHFLVRVGIAMPVAPPSKPRPFQAFTRWLAVLVASNFHFAQIPGNR
jgi:hypothetical protein